jgi:hypothetical protein
MKKLVGISVLLTAGTLTLPLLAQNVTPRYDVSLGQRARLVNAAWPQDQDDRRAQGDEDRRDDRDKDRRDRDRDRDRDRNRDRDRDRGGYGNGRYHGVLAPEWQGKFDSYYQRWQRYRATNNAGEMRSMEKRMQDIMVHYNIPANTPYEEVASPGVGGYRR